MLDEHILQLDENLTPESARVILALKADTELQARVDDFADRHTEGLLTPEETAEYGRFVKYSTRVAILKCRARLLLKGQNAGE